MTTRFRSRAGVAPLLLAVLAASCVDGAVSPRQVAGFVRIDSVVAVPGNVLARHVHATISGADSAWLEFTGTTDPSARTPAVRATEGAQRLLLLGLRQGESYGVRVGIRSRTRQEILTPEASLVTDSVPLPLRGVRLAVTGTSSVRYIAFAVNVDTAGFVAIFDSLGALRWYFSASEALPSGRVADIHQLRGGGFLAHVGFSSGWQPFQGRYFDVAPDTRIRRSFAAPPPYYTDTHEIVPIYAGDSVVSTVLFGYDIRLMDMTRFGGPSAAQIAGHQIFRQDASGRVEYFWNSWDHLSMDGWIEEPQSFKTMQNIDWAHPNALAVDHDGHYLVSWRHLAEITKIDSRTGAVIWRWGGLYNQFTMQDDPLGFFSGQHSIRVLPNGNYLLFDNGLRHAPPQSRAVEYRLDPVARTARMVWEYRPSPIIYTAFTGSVERLANGNTLVGFMWVGRAQEVTASGQVVWDALLTSRGVPLGAYRAHRIPSLYGAIAP